MLKTITSSSISSDSSSSTSTDSPACYGFDNLLCLCRSIHHLLVHHRRLYVYGCGATGRLAKQMETTFWRPFWTKLEQNHPQVADKMQFFFFCFKWHSFLTHTKVTFSITIFILIIHFIIIFRFFRSGLRSLPCSARTFVTAVWAKWPALIERWFRRWKDSRTCSWLVDCNCSSMASAKAIRWSVSLKVPVGLTFFDTRIFWIWIRMSARFDWYVCLQWFHAIVYVDLKTMSSTLQTRRWNIIGDWYDFGGASSVELRRRVVHIIFIFLALVIFIIFILIITFIICIICIIE